jgi:hypothetical protein
MKITIKEIHPGDRTFNEIAEVYVPSVPRIGEKIEFSFDKETTRTVFYYVQDVIYSEVGAVTLHCIVLAADKEFYENILVAGWLEKKIAIKDFRDRDAVKSAFEVFEQKNMLAPNIVLHEFRNELVDRKERNK